MATTLRMLLLLLAAALASGALAATAADGKKNAAEPKADTAAVTNATAPPKNLSEHAKKVGEGNSAFAIDLYQSVAKAVPATENVVLSPVLVASALGAAQLGASSATASRLLKAINPSGLPGEGFHSGLAEVLGDLASQEEEAAAAAATWRNHTWKAASRVYAPSGVTFSQGFVSSSKARYGLQHDKVNLKDKRGALKALNEWAAQNTGGKVKEVAKELNGADGAVFVNALFFKGRWNEKFHHQMVDTRGFLTSRSHTISIQMMHRTGFYNFYHDEKAQVQLLEMQLKGSLESLLIALPLHTESLERLEKLLTKQQLEEWTSKLQKKTIAVSMPKGLLQGSADIKNSLADLGLAEVGDKAKADFSGMTGGRELHLGSLLHTAALEFDTEGEEYDMSVHGHPDMRNPHLFYIDHPFFFLVRDARSGATLLIGRCMRPVGSGRHDEL
ncbi:serpin H1 [Lampetra planeri]